MAQVPSIQQNGFLSWIRHLPWATFWISAVPFVVLLSIWFDYPIQLGDVLSTDSMAESVKLTFRVPHSNIVLSLPWLVCTIIPILEWWFIRRMIAVLDVVVSGKNRNSSAYPELWTQQRLADAGMPLHLFCLDLRRHLHA